MSHPTVTAHGTALVPATPDSSTWTLELSCLAAELPVALDDVARRGHELTAVLDGLHLDPASRSTSGVRVVEEFDYVDGKQVSRGHRATMATTVRLGDLAVASALVGQAVERCQAQVSGPSWAVAPDNPAVVEACRLAVLDAQRKATAYAAGLGLRLGPVVEVRDAEAAPPLPRPTGMVKAVAFESGLDLTPGELPVEAWVDVTFRLDG